MTSREKLHEALVTSFLSKPYCRPILGCLTYIKRDEMVSSLSIDRCGIRYNPKTLNRLSLNEVMDLVDREINHIVCAHSPHDSYSSK